METPITGTKVSKLSNEVLEKIGKEKIIVNWIINTKILQVLGIKTKFDKYSNFSPIAIYSWGILGFDREEGLKFYIYPDNNSLEKCISLIRSCHHTHNIPFIIKGDNLVCIYSGFSKFSEDTKKVILKNGGKEDNYGMFAIIA